MSIKTLSPYHAGLTRQNDLDVVTVVQAVALLEWLYQPLLRTFLHRLGSDDMQARLRAHVECYGE